MCRPDDFPPYDEEKFDLVHDHTDADGEPLEYVAERNDIGHSYDKDILRPIGGDRFEHIIEHPDENEYEGITNYPTPGDNETEASMREENFGPVANPDGSPTETTLEIMGFKRRVGDIFNWYPGNSDYPSRVKIIGFTATGVKVNYTDDPTVFKKGN